MFAPGLPQLEALLCGETHRLVHELRLPRLLLYFCHEDQVRATRTSSATGGLAKLSCEGYASHILEESLKP